MPNGNGNGGNGKNGNGKGKKKKNGKNNGNGRRRTQRNVGSLSQSMVAVPLSSQGGNRRPMLQGVSRQRGSDFLGKVIVQAKPISAKGRIIGTFPVSPSDYPGTRLSQIAELWERYKFTSFAIRYVSAVPNTLACQLVLYIDTDPTDDPTYITDPDALIRQAVSQAGAQQWNFNQSKTIKLALRSDGQLMYTGIDKLNKRFTQQGTAYLIQVTDPVNFNGETITNPIEAGSLFLDWSVDFQIAQINPVAVMRNSDHVLTTQVEVTQLPGVLTVEASGLPHLKVNFVAIAQSFAVDNFDASTHGIMYLDDAELSRADRGATGQEYSMQSNDVHRATGAYQMKFTGTGTTKFNLAHLHILSNIPLTVEFKPNSSGVGPEGPSTGLSKTVDLDFLRQMIAECMTESNVPTSNVVAYNPVDDIYDKPPGYDVEDNTYPDWDDEGLLDDDDPEYEAKFARRNFVEELANDPNYEPIGEPIVITAQTIDINTNVHISDETRSQIDTAVRVIMAKAPELCPYSLVVPFIRDELDTDVRLNVDNDPDDL